MPEVAGSVQAFESRFHSYHTDILLEKFKKLQVRIPAENRQVIKVTASIAPAI